MKTDRETKLEHGSIVAISLAGVLLLFGQTLVALAVGAVAAILFIAASKELGDRVAADSRAAEQENEARRKEIEESERLRAESERLRAESERLQAERERIRCEWRDADTQDTPYEYECVGHPNRTLALRYGISNHASAEEHWRELRRIKLRKRQQVYADEEGTHYLAELPAFGNRQVRVVIQPGTDYVKTFYPMSEEWFEMHADLEMILKDNPTFTLKELATFHVQAVLNAKR